MSVPPPTEHGGRGSQRPLAAHRAAAPRSRGRVLRTKSAAPAAPAPAPVQRWLPSAAAVCGERHADPEGASSAAATNGQREAADGEQG